MYNIPSGNSNMAMGKREQMEVLMGNAWIDGGVQLPRLITGGYIYYSVHWLYNG